MREGHNTSDCQLCRIQLRVTDHEDHKHFDTTSSGVPLPSKSVYIPVLMSRTCPVGSTDLSFSDGCRCDSKATSFQFSENYLLARFEVLTAVLLRTTVCWDVTRRGLSVS
jgi:hypothetical protein